MKAFETKSQNILVANSALLPNNSEHITETAFNR